MAKINIQGQFFFIYNGRCRVQKVLLLESNCCSLHTGKTVRCHTNCICSVIQRNSIPCYNLNLLQLRHGGQVGEGGGRRKRGAWNWEKLNGRKKNQNKYNQRSNANILYICPELIVCRSVRIYLYTRVVSLQSHYHHHYYYLFCSYARCTSNSSAERNAFGRALGIVVDQSGLCE